MPSRAPTARVIVPQRGRRRPRAGPGGHARAGPGRSNSEVAHERRQRADRSRSAARPAPAKARRRGPGWARGQQGLLWMLALVGVAVALGIYPIIRRLTSGWKTCAGVERWGEGDLSVRVTSPAATRWPSWPALQPAAERVETLVQDAQVAAGQRLARTALAAGAHPHGAGADGQRATSARARPRSRATSPSSTS